jgi:Carboxylesterase family
LAGIPWEIYYDEYHTTNGVKNPYKLEIHHGAQVYSISVTRAGTNETVGERVFDFPIQSQVKLPDLKKLFEEIDANQKEIDKVKEKYAGTQVEEETQYDKTGKITKTETNEYTFFYMNGDEITTLVKKDGRPLSEEEQKKENEKTQKRIVEAQKEEKKKEEQEKKKEEKNLEERVVKELAGVVWIDEKAKDVVRLEAYFVGDVHIGGGVLANLQKGTSFIFEQAYINNEVWLLTYVEAHMGVRLLLVKRIKVNVSTRHTWKWLKQLKTGQAPVYRYRFDETLPWPAGSPPDEDSQLPMPVKIGYLFEMLSAKDLPWRPQDQKVSELISSYWTNFAKTGDPNGEGLPHWPTYASQEYEVMHLSADSHAAADEHHAQAVLQYRL